MTKEELAAECCSIIGAFYEELIDAREKAGDYVSALARENVERVMNTLNAIAMGEEVDPEALLPFDVDGD